MTAESHDASSAEDRLVVLLDAERELDARLAGQRSEAEARVRAAQATADERVAARRRRCADEEAQRLSQRRRQFDELLADETRVKQEELSRAMSALEDLRDQLCAQMLADLLLLPESHPARIGGV